MNLTVKIDFSLCTISELEQIITECKTVLKSKNMEPLSPEEISLLQTSPTNIAAVRSYRERTSCSLRDAVDSVSRAESALRAGGWYPAT